MKKLLLFPALFAVFLLMGAGGLSLDALHGVWKIDVRETLIQQGMEPGSQEFTQMLEMMAQSPMQNLTLTIDTAKKLVTFSDGEDEEEGEFTVVSQKDNVFVISVDDEEVYLTLDKGAAGKDILILSEEEDDDDKMVFSR